MIQRINTDVFQATWKRDTHFRKATFKDVVCPHYVNGWVTSVVQGSPQEQYIKSDRERKHVAVKVDDARVDYYFESGQRCFREHRVKLERGPFLTKNQSGRETARLERSVIDFDDWTEDFNESVYRSTRR